MEPTNPESNTFSPEDERELNNILNESLDAWGAMCNMWERIIKVNQKYNSPQLKAAGNHAFDTFQQEINGMRDHIKLSLGRI